MKSSGVQCFATWAGVGFTGFASHSMGHLNPDGFIRPTDAIGGACSQYNNNIIILKRGYTLYDKTSSVDSRAGDAGRSTREPGVVLRPRRGDV